MITVDDVRRIASTLPRSYEAVVRDQIRFRAGRLVYAAFSRDETVMGVGFPKEERAAMVAAEPDKFMLPRKSEMRYNWILVRLDAIDHGRTPRAGDRRLADVRAEKRCGDSRLRC